MALIYRVMAQDGDYPMVGETSHQLGVRAGIDLPVDENGNVHPEMGGMSVSPDWKLLPYFLIPKRLRQLVPAARGSNSRRCWKMGDGPFELGNLAEGLVLRPDSQEHGVVEPAQATSLTEFQAELAATREHWVDGERELCSER
jgi:hypothetical protein